jgi:hypothetical protein
MNNQRRLIMAGLPALNSVNIIGIDATKLEVKNPVAKVTDPLTLDLEFQIGGQTPYSSNFQAWAPPFPYTIEIFYESIGELSTTVPPFSDEGSWGVIAGDSSEGVNVPPPLGIGELFKYEKLGASLPALANMVPGTYKLTMAVTVDPVSILGDFYAVLEGPIIRRT